MEILTPEEQIICASHLEIIKKIQKNISLEYKELRDEMIKTKERKKIVENFVPFFGKKVSAWIFREKEVSLKRKLSKNSSQLTIIEQYFTSYFSIINCIKFAKPPLSNEIMDALTSLSESLKVSPHIPLEVSVELWRIKNNIQERVGFYRGDEKRACIL